MSETQTFENVIYEKDGSVARIIMNRPDKANAQSSAMVWDFDRALKLADGDYDVKVVIIKANGNGFCSGHDVNMRPGTNPEIRSQHGQHRCALEGALRPLFVASPVPMGVPKTRDRTGARILRRKRHLLRSIHRYHGCRRRRLLPDAAPSGPRPSGRRNDDRAVDIHELEACL